mmetsp:Transcript_16724/g.42971  ORF Transcript_16724/g.42971 Transcript_16724/m.42971 type:complete len:80 (-) Transcript_16724:27-266(-)
MRKWPSPCCLTTAPAQVSCGQFLSPLLGSPLIVPAATVRLNLQDGILAFFPVSPCFRTTPGGLDLLCGTLSTPCCGRKL